MKLSLSPPRHVARAAALLLLLLPAAVHATVLTPRFSSCVNAYQPAAPLDSRLNVTDVLASLVNDVYAGEENLLGGGQVDVLRLDLFGALQQPLYEFNNSTTKLVTLFTTAYEAGVQQWESISRLCPSMTTESPITLDGIHCIIPTGPFGLNISIPLYNIHELATLQTQIRVVDTQDPARTMLCVNVYVTPYAAGTWPYKVFLWVPAGIAMAYFVTTWAARFAAGWVVGASRSSMGRREVNMLKWGTMVISGLSGERFGVSSALLRFVTPGLRDILFHIQFVTMLGMVNVNWPAFFYPVVSQSAWADLLWNVSIVSTHHPSVYPTNYTAPITFANQINDPSNQLYLNATGEDRLIDLQSTPDGMQSFAKTVGLRPQDLFGTCLAIFMMLVGAITIIHSLLWCMHCLSELVRPDPNARKQVKYNASRSSLGGGGIASTNYVAHSRSSSNGKEWLDGKRSSTDLNNVPPTPSQPRTKLTAPSKFHRIRKRFAFRGEAGAFHFSALYGNLLRLITTFHFPITAFSIFQLTLSEASIVSRVFAALAFAFISVIIPIAILFKISRTPTGKLYDAARTLLALGTMYNVYEPEKQLYRSLPLVASLTQGIVVGAGQNSGLAQSIVLITVELCSFVATTVWSPWGEGAGMGAQVVFISILRIASIIMTMVLCFEIHLEVSAQQWMTYAILILQAIIFVFFFMMIVTKIVEGLIRLFGRAPFDESTHPIDGGIFAAIMDLDCFNGVRGGKAAERRRRKRDSRALQRNVSVAGSLTTQMMLDRHSQGIEHQGYPLLEQNRRDNYRPVRSSSVDQFNNAVPIDQRRSFSDVESLTERLTDESHGRILDAWRNTGYSDAQPPVSPSEKSIKRQSWGPTPSIRVTDEPQHSRARSSSAMEELMPQVASGTRPPSTGDYNSFGSAPVSYPPSINGQGHPLRPPPVSLHRRRSLNEIGADDEDVRDNSGSGIRRPKASNRWFARVPLNYDSDSEDDHVPDPYDDPQRPRGWRAIFSRRRNVMDERERDEKMARKGAAINESGAALIGLDTPPTSSGGFRVSRKPRHSTSSGDVLAATGQGSTTPLLAPPPASSSFRVQRDRVPRGPRTSPPASPSSTSPPPDVSERSTLSSAGTSFRVARAGPPRSGNAHGNGSGGDSSALPLGATAVVPLAPAPSPPRATDAPPALDFSGYDSSLFRPLDPHLGSNYATPPADHSDGETHAL